jgi:taurine dioxygenase
MKINPINNHFVADVDGIDIGTISDEDFEAVYQAWLQFGVLRLHNQPLDEESLQRFSRRFGPLEERPMGRLPAEAKAKIKNRYVTQLSNIVENGKPIGGLGNSEANWHSDMTYVDTPPPASILLGIEYPRWEAIPTLLINRQPTRLCQRLFVLEPKPSRSNTTRLIPVSVA